MLLSVYVSVGLRLTEPTLLQFLVCMLREIPLSPGRGHATERAQSSGNATEQAALDYEEKAARGVLGEGWGERCTELMVGNKSIAVAEMMRQWAVVTKLDKLQRNPLLNLANYASQKPHLL